MKIATNAFLDDNNRFFYHHFKGICRYLPTFQQLKSSKLLIFLEEIKA